MDIITSTTNSLVKSAVKLQQKKYRKTHFLLEGLKVIEEAILSNLEIDYIFINSSSKDLIDKFNSYNVICTNEAVLSKISTTETEPEIIAIARKKEFLLDDINKSNRVLLLENIKDAGNLGTIVRSAAAFGFDGIILFGDTVDLYNPKTVRSAVGNLWKLPIVCIKDIDILKTKFDNYERIATLPLAKSDLKSFRPSKPILLMFGSEADGLSIDLKNFATTSLTIKMQKNVESLNLAVSAAIFMYEISSI